MYNNTYSNISGTLNDNGENHSVSSHIITLSTSIIVAILSPVAVVGNALVLTAIWRNPSLRTPSYILLTGLAFTDLCTGLITQPFYVAMELTYLIDPLQPKTVHTRPAFLVITAITNGSAAYLTPVTVSIITVMSIERWLHMTRRLFITVSRVCYIVVVLFFLFTPFVVFRVLSILSTTYLPELDIASVSFLLLCLLITSTAYFKVFQIIRNHQQQIHSNFSSQASAQPAINIAKYKKSVFTVLYILAIFYNSYSPVAIAFRLSVVYGSKNKSLTDPFFDVAVAILFLSSSINPLLYLWRMKDIRNEVKSLVIGIIC